MNRFAALLDRLAYEPSRNGKLRLMTEYFRETPDPAFSDPKIVLEQFQHEYRPAAGDPQYGDLVLLAKRDGTLVHSAIYLADDIVFTKNGSTMIHPWMLSTTADLLKRYSFQLPPGQHLTVSYRRKITL